MDKKSAMVFLLLLSVSTGIVYGQDYSGISTSARLYSDGSASIDIVIEPDPTLARLNVSLMGDIYEDVLVVDSDGIILDWMEMNEGIEVDGLGVDQIIISYTTSTLTNKTGSKWTAQFHSDVNAIITLPEDAVLVGLNPTPLGITFIEDNAVLTMAAGTSSISYLLGTTGTQEHALVLLTQADDKITEITQTGVLVPEAEEKLAEAQTAYNDGQYSLSEQLSRKAKDLAEVVETLAAQAIEAIIQVEAEIASKTGDLSDAQELLDSAEVAYSAGDYQTALDDAEEAYAIAQEAGGGGFPFTYLVIIVLILAAGGGYVYMNREKTVETVEKPDSMQSEVDLDEEFKKRPHLRTDDKAILRYIQESGGAFITEVRERFDIPKSSAWRMVKRLEEEGLLSSTTVGRETYLQLAGEEDE